LILSCRSINQKFEDYAVQLTLTQQSVNATNKAENKKQATLRIQNELKEIVKNDIIAFFTDPEVDIVKDVIPKDKDLLRDIRERIHVLHFAKFLSFHVACLLKNPEDAKNFFSSRKNIQYYLIKKGLQIKQYRKSTIDQYRKKFINMFDGDFIADIFKLTKKFLVLRFNRANVTQAPTPTRTPTRMPTLGDDDGNGDGDGDDCEVEMDFNVNGCQPVTPLEDANVNSPATSNPSVIPVNVATYNVAYQQIGIGNGKFIQIYGSYIYKAQEPFVKKMIEKADNILCMTSSHGENDILTKILVEIQDLKALIYQMVTETFVAKVGETREQNASWQARKNTFNLQPNHVKYDVINIEPTLSNAKKIEAYVFAFLAHKGFKLSSKLSKSTAGEFFKLFNVEEDGVLYNMHHSITKGKFNST